MTSISAAWVVLHAQPSALPHGQTLLIFSFVCNLAEVIFCLTFVVRDMRHK